ncbi:protein kinase [Pseudenhygromyxa sp. WMMC2535]|uniref:serine/threonine-protein kinase n=1 Tax=Pseudenhygromyxa sp. WMMC2535 TaxID=2712867 RepID=UPI0015556BD8|nr:serine/threonine-protein kinase [Pseudenhygromyxa sp. WMMC2535]NVB42798.1 protein kinase [Pseudenhygromyxa sp. WMMC2535]
MTANGERDDTPPDDWDGTEDLDEEAQQELQRLQASLGLIDGAPKRLIADRYEIIARQGQGGMGVVYRARDLRLDREVALKLVRNRLFRDDERLKDRLEREAKALAKLEGKDHIVSVHDVGRTGERVYFTMPFVRGQDLRRWQERGSHNLDQLLDLYLQAARGLAAAHALGIVHRDFKPANVLIRTEDHRALVADFGIAEAVTKTDTPPEGLDAPSFRDERLTRTGALLGTLPYIAPERIPGPARAALSGSPASDQFSFCVALWEAIALEPPFPAQTIDQLLARVRAPPAGASKIPAWLRPLLRRGLRVDPEARFPSMNALIRAIERRRALRRRRRSILISTLLVGALALLGLMLAIRSAAKLELDTQVSCTGVAAVAERVWGEDQRQAVLANTELAPNTLPGVVEQLDDLMNEWVGATEQICAEAGGLRFDDERLACAGRWFSVASGYIELLTDLEEPEVAARAGQLIDRLRPPANDFCAFVPPAKVDFNIWVRADQARAAALIGLSERADALSREAVDLAERDQGTPDLAQAYATRAEVLTRAGRYTEALHSFEMADTQAHLSGELEQELSNQVLWAKVFAISTRDLLDYDRALDAIRAKQLLLPGIEPEPLRAQLAAELEDAAGVVDYQRDAYEDALAHHERALALLGDLELPELRAKIQISRANALTMLDRNDEAREAYRSALEQLQSAGVPPSHATLLDVELALGILEAEASHPLAFEILDRVIEHSDGRRKLSALNQALQLALNLDDEAHIRSLSPRVLALAELEPRDESQLSLNRHARANVATALVLLADPKGEALFDELLAREDTPSRSLDFHKSRVRALEDRDDCIKAASALAELDGHVRAHDLVDDDFLSWRGNRERHDCQHAPFSNR